MKKLTHVLALSTILLGALSPTGQAIADTVPTQNSNLLTTSPTKVVTGVPATRTYLEADTVTFNNEFTGTNGDELHMGGQYNDKINISTTFKPTGTLPPYHATANTVDGVPGIWVPGGFDIVFETYMQTFNGNQTNFLSPETTTFKVTANGVDISSDFSLSFVNTGLSAGLGLYLTYTPSGDGMLAIGSGLEVELSIDEPDIFPTGGNATYFNIGSTGQFAGGFRLETETGIVGQNIPVSAFGDSSATLQPLKLFFGYAPTILGVEDKEIPLNSSFDPMEGVTANDKHDGDVTSALTHSGEVDTTKAGVYPIEYSVTDSDGQTTTATRNITVKAPLPTTGGDVTVKYVDENGTEIHDPQTLTGNVNDAYDASTVAYKLAIDGYTLDESKLPDNATGTFTDQPQTVTYTYTKNPVAGGDVTVKYVDENGTEIHDPQTLTGNVNDAYDASTVAYKLAIDGYTLDESKLPDNATGTFTDQPQTVTYTYTKNPVAGGDVTVKYVDENGTEIHAPQTLTGNVNDAYDASTAAYKLAIDGYTLDESKLPDNATGTFTDQPQTVTYTYKKNEDKSSITVHDSTLTVGDSWTAQDNFDSALNKKGDKVPFDQIKVDGAVDTSKAGTYKVTYTYDESSSAPEVLAAEVGETQQGTTTVTATITVKDKAPVTPGNPDNPGEPTTPTTPDQPDQPNGSGNTNNNTPGNTTVNVSHSGNGNKLSNKTLPDTGEENNVSLIASGLGMLLALLGLILFRETKQKREK